MFLSIPIYSHDYPPRPTRPSSLALASVLIFLGLCYPPILPAVTPDQVVVIINDSNLDSVRLGRYYVKKRGIPRSHLIALDLPNRESITRSEFEEDVVLPLRKALTERNLSKKTRVLTTLFGVPLKIQAPKPTIKEEEWEKDAREWQQATMNILQGLQSELTHLSEPLVMEDQSSAIDSESGSSDATRLIHSIMTLLSSVQEQINRQKGSPTLRNKENSLLKIKRQILGQRTNVPHFDPGSPLPSQGSSPSLVSPDVQSAVSLITLLSQNPTDKNRELAYELAQRYLGLWGVLTLTIDEIDRFSIREADASVDSELSLLWYDFGEYSLSNRKPNPLFAWYPGNKTVKPSATRSYSPILMVSRIDAPTAELAKQMVENVLSTEESGLAGNAYIDARGMISGGDLSYGDYDESLRSLATFLEKHTAYPVHLENTDRRFSRIGEAPSVAIYAGWYRYRQYEDAFTFNPGAIGYHIASGEAISLHHPNESGWCKNALERGITVTLGPTNEPYLDSFPKPSALFGLLLTGRYSIVEAYYLTTRYVSWRMTLIGDPLYNPWKNKPLASLVDLKNHFPSFGSFVQLPPSPSSLPIADPSEALFNRHREKESLLQQISSLLR